MEKPPAQLTASSYPVVCVTWIDHMSITKDGWPSIVKLKEEAADPAVMHTVGYLIDKTDDYVLIAQTITDDGLCSEAMKVMSNLIQSTKVIKKASK